MNEETMIQVKPNPHARLFHSRVLVSDRSLNMQSDHPVVTALSAIPGIQGAYVYRHELTIVKSAAFTWEEIAPQVEALLAGLERIES